MAGKIREPHPFLKEAPYGFITKMGKDLGVSKAFISQLLRGHKTPSLKMAFAIEDYTNGRVKARDFLA